MNGLFGGYSGVYCSSIQCPLASMSFLACFDHADCDLPPVALEEDRIVEIWGQPARVRKALELVASHLRKYLVDRSVIPLFDPHVSSWHCFEHYSCNSHRKL